MKLWQYYGIVGAIWIAPVQGGSWIPNLMLGLLALTLSIYYSRRSEPE